MGRVEKVKDAFEVKIFDRVGPATAWIQTIATLGLLGAQTVILWNWPGAIEVPWVGPVTPHGFVAADLGITVMSAMLGGAFGLMANGSVSDVRGNALGIILGLGLVPAGANLVLPAVGGYGVRKAVEGVSVGIARRLDRKSVRR